MQCRLGITYFFQFQKISQHGLTVVNGNTFIMRIETAARRYSTENFAKFKGKRLHWGLSVCNFINNILQHRSFTLNFPIFLRRLTLQRFSKRLLLLLQ